MSDNPSSSVPVSKGEEIAARWVERWRGDKVWDDTGRDVAALIDSALASQEARHRQEMEEAKRERDNWKAEFDLLFGVARSDAKAAEQREREAGERAEREATRIRIDTLLWAATQVCRWYDETKCRERACPCVPFRDRLAAIRPAPSPASAPVYTGVDWGVNSSSFTVEVPVSPVEPGSDPQEPETR